MRNDQDNSIRIVFISFIGMVEFQPYMKDITLRACKTIYVVHSAASRAGLIVYLDINIFKQHSHEIHDSLPVVFS